jgi:hypothetical protein
MEIEDIDGVGTQLLERCFKVFPQLIGLVDSCLIWVHLCCDSKATLPPLGITGPGFLLAAHIHARRIDFIVALGLEVVKVLYEFIVLGDTSSRRLVRTCGV